MEYWLVLIEKNGFIVGALWIDEPSLRPYSVAQLTDEVEQYPLLTQNKAYELASQYAMARNYTITNASGRLISGGIQNEAWGFHRDDGHGWLYVPVHFWRVYENHTDQSLPPQFPYP